MSDEGKRMSCEALDKIRLFWRTMSNPIIVKDLVDHVDDAAAEIARLKRKMCEGCVYDPEYGIEVCEHVINARGESAQLRGQLAAMRIILMGARDSLETVSEVVPVVYQADCMAYEEIDAVLELDSGEPEAAVIATSLEHMKVGKPSTFKAWAQAVKAMLKAKKG